MPFFKKQNNQLVNYSEPSTAEGIAYDNTASGLTATNVQDAVDEINADLPELSTIKYDDTTHYIQVKSGGIWVNYKYFNPSASYALIPTMTSNTTPEGVASANIDDSNAYKSFDNNDITYCWGGYGGTHPLVISYNFENPVRATSYSGVFTVGRPADSPLTVKVELQKLDDSWVIADNKSLSADSATTHNISGDIDVSESIKAVRISVDGAYSAYFSYYDKGQVNSFQLYGYTV